MQLKSNTGLLSCQGLKENIERLLPGLWQPLEGCLSTILTLLLADNHDPVSLLLVGPSGGSKTATLNLITHPDMDIALGHIIYRSDKFTPKSFVSHAANVKKKALAEIDLLPRIRYKTLIVGDLVPMFTGKEEELTERFSILTRVLDGQGLLTDSGTQGQRGYSGDYLFSFIGAITPSALSTKIWQVIGLLGSRLLFFRMPNVDLGIGDLADGLYKSDFGKRIEEGAGHVADYLVKVFNYWKGVRGVEWDRSATPRQEVKTLALYADFIIKMRIQLPSWQGGVYTPFNKESPYRILSNLFNLARGRALLYGRTTLIGDDLGFIWEVSRSSVPEDRRQIVEALSKNGGSITVERAEKILMVSRETARKVMEGIECIGIASIEKGRGNNPDILVLKPEFKWICS